MRARSAKIERQCCRCRGVGVPVHEEFMQCNPGHSRSRPNILSPTSGLLISEVEGDSERFS